MIKICKKCGLGFIAKFSSQKTHEGRCPVNKKNRPKAPIKFEKTKEKIKRVKKERASTPLEKRVKKYGITVETYNNMLEEQGGRCAICGSVDSILYIDHSHKTNKVRGLLCCSCNTGIGLLKDNKDILLNAIKYLA